MPLFECPNTHTAKKCLYYYLAHFKDPFKPRKCKAGFDWRAVDDWHLWKSSLGRRVSVPCYASVAQVSGLVLFARGWLRALNTGKSLEDLSQQLAFFMTFHQGFWGRGLPWAQLNAFGWTLAIMGSGHHLAWSLLSMLLHPRVNSGGRLVTVSLVHGLVFGWLALGRLGSRTAGCLLLPHCPSGALCCGWTHLSAHLCKPRVFYLYRHAWCTKEVFSFSVCICISIWELDLVSGTSRIENGSLLPE